MKRVLSSCCSSVFAPSLFKSTQAAGFKLSNSIAPTLFKSRDFSSSTHIKHSFTETIDPELDRLKAPTRSETVANNREPTHTIHYVINTLNELGRATSTILYNEINNRYPGQLVSKRHLKKLLMILKRGHKVTAIQPLRGQLTYKKVSFEYKLTKQMKKKLEKPAKEESVVGQEKILSLEQLSEDELFDKTLEAVQKGK